MHKVLSVILVFTFFFLSRGTTQTQFRTQQTNQQKKQNFPIHSNAKCQLSYVIINATGEGFGYNIFNYNRKIIHQPSVPSLQGNKGFATKKDAAKVAKLVIKKINNGLTPTVTQQELNFLKIYFQDSKPHL